jgi:pimeloyl-ACP methyl ester carboxylesterase
MPRVGANGIDVEYEAMGNPADPAVLLVMGMSVQLTGWDDGFCKHLVDHGYYVIRYDNRDVGLSTHFDGLPIDTGAVLAVMLSDEAPVPAVPTHCRTWGPTASGCSTPWAYNTLTSWERPWAA